MAQVEGSGTTKLYAFEEPPLPSSADPKPSPTGSGVEVEASACAAMFARRQLAEVRLSVARLSLSHNAVQKIHAGVASAVSTSAFVRSAPERR
jgi:hypothetical protein